MGLYPYEVVISGISGKFPNCHNVQEFKEKLFSKEMMLIPDHSRWNPVEQDKPYMTGKVPDVDKFDVTFFGIASRLGRRSDPVMGPTLEASTEAMIDAGVNPYAMKGKNISVIVGSTTTDAEVSRYFEGSFLDGQAMQGLARTMFANRISYVYNFTGPSYNVDSSWVSAVQGLEKAAAIVGQGHAEAAIVTCVNLTFHNSFEREYKSMGPNIISQAERCSPFDAKADGFLRSEGTVSFFVQRLQDAKRNYCTVLNTQTRCLHGDPSSFTHVNPSLETFLRNFYTESRVNPRDVSYVETFGFCNKERDAQELNAVEKVFCSQKSSPLLIGSGTGNYGIAETSSSFFCLTKAIIALEEGVIPPTINYNSPNPDVLGLIEGRLRPVTEATKLSGSLVAVNALSYSGNVAHTLLRQNEKTKPPRTTKNLPSDELPRLYILQARNEQGANYITKKIASAPLDTEFVSLVNDLFKVQIPHYLWRGYSIIPGQDGKAVSATMELNPVKRPVWFVFSGMGSHWAGMGRDLLHLPAFAAAIDRCDACLRPLGVDLRHILTSTDPALFDNILNCFVGITAVQIALVDCLRILGVTPDGMIGHSAGEMCCAYADGCLTLEETMLAAYYRGRATLDVKHGLVKGMMAAIGIGYQGIKDQLPPTIEVACHNSADSCTLSGPEDDVLQFVDKLKKDGVFARAVNVAGFAYHSRYIRSVAPGLLDYLSKLIKSPKPRSSKWVCTSAPESQWNSDHVRLGSAEYFTNNLLSPVYFEEGCEYIPKDATLIEIAPHGLLQAILRRSISSKCVNIPLTNRTAGSNLYFFLSAIGKLYLNNVDVDANALYPPIEYPVSRGTPSLSTLVTWDHDETRLMEFRADIKTLVQKNKTEATVPVSVDSPEYELWREHRINGSVVLPPMQLLMYPCAMIFTSKRLKMESQSFVLEDVIFSELIEVVETEHNLTVTFSPASLYFEVSHEVLRSATGENIVSGKLREDTFRPLSIPEIGQNRGPLSKVSGKEVYEVLSQHGIHLGPQFQVIKQITFSGKNECLAKIKWTSDAIVFVDALFKLLTYIQIENNPSSMHQPTSFIKLEINMPLLSELPSNTVLDVHFDSRCNRLASEAALLTGLSFKSTPLKKNESLKWKEFKFKPYFDNAISLKEFLHTSQQLAREAGLGTWLAENPSLHLLLVKSESPEKQTSYQNIVNVFQNNSCLYEKVVEVEIEKAIDMLKSSAQQRYLIVGDLAAITSLSQASASERFYCITPLEGSPAIGPNLRTILSCDYQDGSLALLKKIDTESPVVVTLEGKDWMERVRKTVGDLPNRQPVVLVTRTLEPRFVLPILAKESFAERIRTVFIQQSNKPQYSNSSPTFSTQLVLGLPVNVLSEGSWGSLRSEEVDIDIKNNLDTLFDRSDPGIDINYIGLNPPNYKDCNLDLPVLKCVDYSGTTESSQPVMGVAQFDADSRSLRLDPLLRWPVPSDFTLEDAVTVPVVYGLAYYCIYLKAKVEPGETVLVHAGMSPIGQAVICMALRAGASVITFVENREEERSLRKLFPKVNPSHVILNGLEDMDIPVKKITKGRGVDVIVNCLRGRQMQSTIKLMGIDCRFLHLSHISPEDRESIGMLSFLKRTSLHGVTVESLLRCSEEEKLQIQRAVLDGIVKGDVRPLKRKAFSCRSQTGVLEFIEKRGMEEKTVLCIKKKSLSSQSLRFEPEEFIIIAGTSSNLWLDVASWALSHGGKHIVVLTTENMIAANNFHKVDRLISNRQATFTLYPLSRFDSVQTGIDLLEELLQLRPIDTFLCLNMNESSSRMRNLELVVRKAVPRLRRFVGLLGQGAGVCEARARCGLHVCCIQKATPLQSPASVLPYLTTILSDKNANATFFVVEDSSMTTKSELRTSSADVISHLPHSFAELELLGLNPQSQLQEMASLSPRYEFVKHQLLPFFVIPGISSSKIEPLTQQLMHPVFCPTLPPSHSTVEQSAEYLLQQIEAIQEKGPYNLIGETWSGVVALHLASLLEARGHRTTLFLLDAAPGLTQARAKVFRRQSGIFASTEFLSCILGLQGNVLNGVSKFKSWEEELDLTTKYLQSTQQIAQEALDGVRDYASALKSRLTSIMDYKFQQLKIDATVHLIQPSEYCDTDLLDMSMCCHKRPQLHKIENDTISEVLRNPKTAAIINENASFTWNV